MLSVLANFAPIPNAIGTDFVVKRQREKRLNFYACIKSLHMISRSFGLLPFTITFSSNGKIAKAKVGIFNAIWFVGSITVNLILVYFAFYSSRSSANSYSSVAYLSDRFILIFQLLMCISSIILSVFNCNKFLKILREFVAFDRNVNFTDLIFSILNSKVIGFISIYKIESFGVVIDFKRTKRNVLRLTVFWTTLLVCIVFGSYLNFKSTHETGSVYNEVLLASNYFSYILQNNLYVCEAVAHQVLLSSLIDRYQHLNNLLRYVYTF